MEPFLHKLTRWAILLSTKRSKIRGAAMSNSSQVLCMTVVFMPFMKIRGVHLSMATLGDAYKRQIRPYTPGLSSSSAQPGSIWCRHRTNPRSCGGELHDGQKKKNVRVPSAMTQRLLRNFQASSPTTGKTTSPNLVRGGGLRITTVHGRILRSSLSSC